MLAVPAEPECSLKLVHESRVNRIAQLRYGRVPQLLHTWLVSQAGGRAHEYESQGALGVVNGKASGDEAAAGTTYDNGGFKLDASMNAARSAAKSRTR